MIFAHGPLGYLLADRILHLRAVRPFVRKSRYRTWWRWFGFFAGILPDVDLLYVHLVDATSSHRAFWTHAPVPFVCIGFVVILFAWKNKKRTLMVGAMILTLGILSHHVTDMIAGQIMFFFPFSRMYIGLSDIPSIFFRSRLLILNFLVEGSIATFFLLTLTSPLRKKWRRCINSVIAMMFMVGLFILFIGNRHVFRVPWYRPLEDNDHDGIVNRMDSDSDGDGVRNIFDSDADGDGVSNTKEIQSIATQFEGAWHDPTNLGLLQVPFHLGLVSRDAYVFSIFASLGINLRLDMTEDYAQNPQGYTVDPFDTFFDLRWESLETWLTHTHRMLDVDREMDVRIGDILIFTSNHMVLVVNNDDMKNSMVLDVHPDRSIHIRSLRDIEEWEGKVIRRGRILSDEIIRLRSIGTEE